MFHCYVRLPEGIYIHYNSNSIAKDVEHSWKRNRFTVGSLTPSKVSIYRTGETKTMKQNQSTVAKYHPKSLPQNSESNTTYCWWQPEIRQSHQLSLVVYPIIYEVLYMPGGSFGISEPPTSPLNRLQVFRHNCRSSHGFGSCCKGICKLGSLFGFCFQLQGMVGCINGCFLFPLIPAKTL